MPTGTDTHRTETLTGLHTCAVRSAVVAGVSVCHGMTTVESRQAGRTGFRGIARPEALATVLTHLARFQGHPGPLTVAQFTLAIARVITPGREAGTPA